MNVYLSVFQLIMKGQIGHAAELRHTADARAEAAKKSAKAGGGRRRPSAREQRRRTKDKAAKHGNGVAVDPVNQVQIGRSHLEHVLCQRPSPCTHDLI